MRISSLLAALVVATLPTLIAPALAQTTSSLYDAARNAGASATDAAGLALAATQEAQLLATNGAMDDFFGVSVSLSGERALVGAYLGDSVSGVQNAGAAYVFERQTNGVWIQTAQLAATGGVGGDFFGISVSLSGDRALVGASRAAVGAAVRAGSAYVFDRQANGAWTQTAQLLASGGTQNDEFGYSVSLSGARALVGAPEDAAGGVTNPGSADVFEQQADGTWRQTAHLTAADGATGDFFGQSVALSGERALVASYFDTVGAARAAGSVYVFERQGGGAWSQTAQLAATDGAGGDYFGFSLSLSGERALVGAAGDDVGAAVNAGSAYVFERQISGAWVLTAQLVATDGAVGDQFGFSVSLSGTRALVGAQADNTVSGGTDAGSAYVYERQAGGTWVQTDQIVAAGGAASDYFGYSVSLSGERALVGAYFTDTLAGYEVGSAYVFALAPLGTAVAEDGTEASFTLSAPRPNPAAYRASLEVTLDRPQHVRATLIDALGRTVAVLHDGEAAGILALGMDTRALAPGVYVVRVVAGGRVASARLVVAR